MPKKQPRRKSRARGGPVPDLSRRERQIMDVLHRRGEATALEVSERMPSDTTHDSVRVTLRILEKKGHVHHRVEGLAHVYAPVVPRTKARQQAVAKLLETFFPGEPAQAVLSLLHLSGSRLAREDLEEIARWIEEAKAEEES